MVFRYFYNCFCPRIIDEDEIKRDSSDDSIAPILPCDFIPENESNHHPVPVRATPPVALDGARSPARVPDGARTPTRGARAPIPISNTSCDASAVATAYNTSLARSNHG